VLYPLHFVSRSRRYLALDAGTSSTWQARLGRAMLLCSSSVKRRWGLFHFMRGRRVTVTQRAGDGRRGWHARAKERYRADRGRYPGHAGVEQRQRRPELLDGCVAGQTKGARGVWLIRWVCVPQQPLAPMMWGGSGAKCCIDMVTDEFTIFDCSADGDIVINNGLLLLLMLILIAILLEAVAFDFTRQHQTPWPCSHRRCSR
jgi:hypothetical protein